MARKKSASTSAREFKDALHELGKFSEEIFENDISAKYVSWCYDLKIIILYKEFERLMLNCIVAAVNNDTSHMSKKKNINFPRHLTDEVCEFIVTGGKYFDFKGRAGLIQTLKAFLPDDHYLVRIIKDKRFEATLDRLSALRNFAAHESAQSKSMALRVTGRARIGTAGSYLKANGGVRFGEMVYELDLLADRIIKNAPF